MLHMTVSALCRMRTTIASNDRIIRLSITRIRTTPRTMMGHPRRRTYYINTTHAYNANTDSYVCTGITHKTKADTATTIDTGVHNYTSTNSNTQSTMNTDAHATRVRRRAHTWWRVRLNTNHNTSTRTNNTDNAHTTTTCPAVHNTVASEIANNQNATQTTSNTNTSMPSMYGHDCE